jgi:hypothetical protein
MDKELTGGTAGPAPDRDRKRSRFARWGRTRPGRPLPGVRRWPARIAPFVIVALVVGIKVVNYGSGGQIRPTSLVETGENLVSFVETTYRNAPALHDCDPGLTQRVVDGGFVCTTVADDTVTHRIFNRYPALGGPRAAIYPSTTDPDPAAAAALLDGVIEVPRHEPYRAGDDPDWVHLDPYRDGYWRFHYYSMRPAVALIDAYAETGDERYLDRLRSLTASFLSEQDPESLKWSDEHAVAFRGMALVYQWWSLRARHVLSAADSDALLEEISRTAEYLTDPNHYDPETSHGTNESAALLLIAHSFPDLPGAADWSALARTRLTQGLALRIDEDGVLIENSPYYHFYELDKLWQIRTFSRDLGIPLADDLDPVIDRMVRYGTHILRPDRHVPLLGASTDKEIHLSGAFQEMAEEYPAFGYALSGGKKGEEPDRASVTFPSSGHTVLRSGWGDGGSPAEATYVTFNVGSYRTTRSQLDLLGITLFGQGGPLLTDGGLYSNEPGPLHDYFEGSTAHNVVTVDGRNQTQGEVSAGPLLEQDGITHQSGTTLAYDGVTDRRSVLLLDATHVLVVDRLDSEEEHSYEQRWHLPPGASTSRDGLTLTATVDDRTLEIRQLGDEETTVSSVTGRTTGDIGGVCSRHSGELESCEEVSYSQRGTSARFLTLITIGQDRHAPDPRYDADADVLFIDGEDRQTRISLGVTPGSPGSVTPRLADVPEPDVTPLVDLEHRQGTAVPGVRWGRYRSEGARSAVTLTSGGDQVSTTLATTTTDLSHRVVRVRMRVNGWQDVTSLYLDLTSDDWGSYTRISLKAAYQKEWEGEWVTLSLGRDARGPHNLPHWYSWGTPVDWGDVTGVRLGLEAGPGSTASAAFDGLDLVPEQERPAVLFVFDDGFESILPAAAYMREHGMPGNVATIGKYTRLPRRGYLNTFQLHHLQDDWGWNVVNHTQRHLDAVEAYTPREKYGAYDSDVLDNLLWLESEGLNSAPNWIVYPHGMTDAGLAEVIQRYYVFGRITGGGAESFPYGSPLRVKTLEVNARGENADTVTDAETPVSVVVDALADAKTYRNTLILTFHRISTRPSDPLGYPMEQFARIVDAVEASGLPVVTLSELDTMNGVSGACSVDVEPPEPSLITVEVRTTQRGWRLSDLWSR